MYIARKAASKEPFASPALSDTLGRVPVWRSYRPCGQPIGHIAQYSATPAR
ncbi:MAG: hypothetical protein LBK00_05690 [Treponema sp.]|nr:hypothetical protein [Treponema sp.]